MKTQAVRMDEDMIRLVNAVAKIRGCRPSDVHREALRKEIEVAAKENDTIAKLHRQLAEQRRATAEAEIAESIGRTH
jgi:hypothetical protein